MTGIYPQLFHGHFPGFLFAARETTAEFRHMNLCVFDITVDPIWLGYGAKACDIMHVCQVLHTTPDMHMTLSHCRKLLRQGDPDADALLV